MKKLLLIFATVLIATSANAQIVSSQKETKSTKALWQTFTLSYDIAKVVADNYSGDLDFGISAEWTKATKLSESLPLYLELGVAGSYCQFSDNFEVVYEGEDYQGHMLESFVSVSVPARMMYEIKPADDVSILPYVGLLARVNILSQNKIYCDGESATNNYFDREDMDCKRIQFGYQLGVKAKLCNSYLVGIGLTKDLSKYCNGVKFSATNISLGFLF